MPTAWSNGPSWPAPTHLPEVPPRWLLDLPLVGGMLERAWEQAAALGLRDLLPRLSPYAGNLTRWFVSEVGSIGLLLFQFLLTVLISGVLYSHGEAAADQMRRFAQRLGGEHGASAVALAGGAIRGVALGVGVTALVQALLGGLGLALAGVPFAGLLTALMFMLCIAQTGPHSRAAGGGRVGAVAPAAWAGRLPWRCGACWWARWTTSCAPCSSGWAPTCRCC
jgi:predicted PurR-regulated permease PerM